MPTTGGSSGPSQAPPQGHAPIGPTSPYRLASTTPSRAQPSRIAPPRARARVPRPLPILAAHLVLISCRRAWSVPLFLLHLSHPPHPPHPPRRADGRRRRCCGHRPRRLRLRRRDAVSAAATPSPQSFTNYHHPPRRRPRHLPPPAAIRTANRATDRAAERASDRAADGAANRAAAAVRRPAAPRASPPSTPPPPPSTHRAADHTTRRHPPHRPPADGTVDPAAGRAAAAMQRAAVIPLLPLLPHLSPPSTPQPSPLTSPAPASPPVSTRVTCREGGGRRGQRWQEGAAATVTGAAAAPRAGTWPIVMRSRCAHASCHILHMSARARPDVTCKMGDATSFQVRYHFKLWMHLIKCCVHPPLLSRH